MTKSFLIATCNKGKQNEYQRMILHFMPKAKVSFPRQGIKVVEDGKNFNENALKKALAYMEYAEKGQIVAGDDSGLIIPALNDEPGVFTRRWAGYEMTDEQIIEYCLDRMKNLQGKDRRAVIRTVIAAVDSDGNPTYFSGEIRGHIAEEPLKSEITKGFPVHSLFWVDSANRPLYQAIGAKDFVSHRQQAIMKMLGY